MVEGSVDELFLLLHVVPPFHRHGIDGLRELGDVGLLLVLANCSLEESENLSNWVEGGLHMIQIYDQLFGELASLPKVHITCPNHLFRIIEEEVQVLVDSNRHFPTDGLDMIDTSYGWLLQNILRM